MTPAGEITTLVEFAGLDGRHPKGGLVQASDGSLYGATEAGGEDWSGTVFRLTPGGDLTQLVRFNRRDALEDGLADTGAGPGGLALGEDGCLYGTTVRGGRGGSGTIFRLTREGRLSTLVEFADEGNDTWAAWPSGRRGTFMVQRSPEGHPTWGPSSRSPRPAC